MYEKETQTIAASEGKSNSTCSPKNNEPKLDASVINIDDFYAQAWDEINDQGEELNKALWAKAFAYAEGDENKTRAKYIDLRVTQLQEIYDQNLQREMAIEIERQAKFEAQKKADQEEQQRATEHLQSIIEAQRKAAQEERRKAREHLRSLADQIQSFGHFNDARNLIEELGGTYKYGPSESGKYEAVITLDGKTHKFSDEFECIKWLKKNIPLILDGHEELINESDQGGQAYDQLREATLDDCLKELNRRGFIITESGKSHWIVTSSTSPINANAYSITDLCRIITEADSSIVLSYTSTGHKGDDTTTTAHTEAKTNYTNTGNKLSHPDILTSAALNTVASAPPKKHNKVLKTIGIIFAVLGLLVVIAFARTIGKDIGRSAVNNYEKGKLDAAIEKTLMETSQQINKQLPMMVDSETRWDTAMCAGKHVAYKYTMINLLEKDLDINAFTNEINTMLLKNQCSNESMVKALKMGVQYSYMYQDRNGTLLATININKNNCGF